MKSNSHNIIFHYTLIYKRMLKILYKLFISTVVTIRCAATYSATTSCHLKTIQSQTLLLLQRNNYS